MYTIKDATICISARFARTRGLKVANKLGRKYIPGLSLSQGRLVGAVRVTVCEISANFFGSEGILLEGIKGGVSLGPPYVSDLHKGRMSGFTYHAIRLVGWPQAFKSASREILHLCRLPTTAAPSAVREKPAASVQ